MERLFEGLSEIARRIRDQVCGILLCRVPFIILFLPFFNINHILVDGAMAGWLDMILVLDAQDRRTKLNATSEYLGLTLCDEDKDKQGKGKFDQQFQEFSGLGVNKFKFSAREV
jgi:hypothetical protein